jgi:hypothetical protein
VHGADSALQRARERWSTLASDSPEVGGAGIRPEQAESHQPALLQSLEVLEREWDKQHAAAVYWKEAARELADQLKTLGQQTDAEAWMHLDLMLAGPPLVNGLCQECQEVRSPI